MDDKLAKLSNVIDKVTPELIFSIGPVSVTSTVLNQWLTMAILFLLVYLATRKLSFKPTGAQTLLEMLLEYMYSMLDSIAGKENRKYLPYFASLFFFILVMNLLWFIPGRVPPTSDLSTTVALALCTVVFILVVAISQKSLGYFKHYIEPTPGLLPLNILEEFIRPVTLSMRLFGNMFGEKIVVTVIAILVPLLVPVPLMLLGVLIGILQAFIFALLSLIYFSFAVKGH